MSDALLWGILTLSLLNLGVLIFLLVRPPASLSEGMRKAVEEDLRKGREEAGAAARNLREEVTGSLTTMGEGLSTSLTNAGKLQQEQLGEFSRQLKELSESNTCALDRIRDTLDARVKQLQEENEKKLEEMRKTVDEKLHGTLEKRLGESFKLVSERLEAVQKGLGEMQSLATDVGQLQRVLTNVKARGTWSEVQLGALLEQILAPGQFERNISTKEGSNERVEFAIRFPGRSGNLEEVVWLPIDSKFPQEDYLRLQQAADEGDSEGVQRAADALVRSLKVEAQKISEKYLDPPRTTEIGIMFLATEGLYAEALRQPGFTSDLMRDFRILVAGPTTLAALLNSFRWGFQTMALEKRASEVWEVLGAVKTEFGKFGEVLGRVKKQLGTVTSTIEKAEVRTRQMDKKLTAVQELPTPEAQQVLQLPAVGEEELEFSAGPEEMEEGEE